MQSRRSALGFVGAVAWFSLVVGAQAAPIGGAGAQTLELVEIAEGIDDPTDLAGPNGDSRLFVSTLGGKIFVIEFGVLKPQPFLDISGLVFQNEGLMSLSFHPDYESNGRFFVTYLDPNFEVWLVEYTASANPNLADPASARVLIGPYTQVGQAHNWNCIRFGPDGMLYVATGDGGASHTANFGQDMNSLNGKILRLDVDLPAPYVPADNPLVGTPGVREEIWAYGLRNPWRISFDDVTGDMYIAEVGAADWEEVNFIPAGAAGPLNFGWRCLEGPDCTAFGCCSTGGFTDPIHLLDHDAGFCAVIGGAVYRGSALPWLQGSYIFSDFCSGKVWSMVYDGTNVTTLREHTDEFAAGGSQLARPITSISADSDGELYLLDRTGGQIYKVVARGTNSYCGAAINSVGLETQVNVNSSISVADNNFDVTVSDGIPGGFGLFFYGDRRVRFPFGDGFRCVGGFTARLQPPIALNPSGTRTRAYDLTQPPIPDATILPGSSWHFQFWYRDLAAGGAGFNVSNGVTVTFRP